MVGGKPNGRSSPVGAALQFNSHILPCSCDYRDASEGSRGWMIWLDQHNDQQHAHPAVTRGAARLRRQLHKLLPVLSVMCLCEVLTSLRYVNPFPVVLLGRRICACV